jgi:hypothetical protein
MDKEKDSSDHFLSIMSELRKKWIHSLFKKRFGFEPRLSITLKGNAEQRFETLVKIHQFKIAKWALLNNKFVNTSKSILLHNRFANFFRKK